MSRFKGNGAKQKAERIAERKAQEALNRARISDSNLVNEDESNLLVAADLGAMDAETRRNCREMIRLCRHICEAIDKRRLLSDPVTGGDPATPGDEFMAELGRKINLFVDKFNERRRAQKRRMNDELMRKKLEFQRDMESVEGWFDPDVVNERMLKRAESLKTPVA